MKRMGALFALVLVAPAAYAAVVPGPEIELPSAARTLEGKVRDAYGLLTEPSTAEPERIARSYLDENAGGLAIPSVGELRLTSVRDSLTATHYRFAQTHAGGDVVGAEVSVHVRDDGSVVAVHSRAVDRFPGGVESVGWERAAQIAKGEAEGDPVGVRRVLFASGLDALPAWEVEMFRAVPLAGSFVYVHVSTGEVLGIRETVRTAEAQGRVWINPIVASGNPDLTDSQTGIDHSELPVGLSPRTKDFSAYYTDVTLLDLEEGSNGLMLAGPHVRIADQLASGTDLRFAKHDLEFEEIQAYYWIDWSQRNIQALGFDEVANYPIDVYLHDQNNVFNAFYRGHGDGTGEIHFGYHAVSASVIQSVVILRGFADAAEDGEVVLHEYGHAILDNQVPNFNSGPLHEGWGDFWAATQFSRLSNGHFDSCLSEWFIHYLGDTHAQGHPPCIRDIDNDITFDYSLAEAHGSGQIWSGALWNLRKELGREEMERLALEANFLLPTDARFHEGAEALLLADANLNGAANARLILSEFASRKVTDLFVTQPLLDAIRAADLRLLSEPVAPSSSGEQRATPGFELALVPVALGAALAAARRGRSP